MSNKDKEFGFDIMNNKVSEEEKPQEMQYVDNFYWFNVFYLINSLSPYFGEMELKLRGEIPSSEEIKKEIAKNSSAVEANIEIQSYVRINKTDYE